MSEDKSSQVSSRREFLKKTCRTTGYAIPLVMVLKFGSASAWADSYGRSSDNGLGKNHDGFFDQLGRFFANLFNH